MIYSLKPSELLLHATFASAPLLWKKNWILCQFPWVTIISVIPWINFFHLSRWRLKVSGSVHHVIPLREASKIPNLFSLQPSWWSIWSIFFFNKIRLSKMTSFSSTFLNTLFRSKSQTTSTFFSLTTTL